MNDRIYDKNASQESLSELQADIKEFSANSSFSRKKMTENRYNYLKENSFRKVKVNCSTDSKL